MVTFTLDRFEQVAALPETVLLRVTGSWRSDQREPISIPLLVIDDGREAHHFSTLPGPEEQQPVADPEGNERWRGAFSVPRQLVETAGVAFALETAGGNLFDLPLPQNIDLVEPGQEQNNSEFQAGNDPVGERRRRAQAEKQAEEYRRSSVENAARFEAERATRRKLEEQQGETTRQLGDAQSQLHTLQARLDGLQAELRAANELAQAARHEAQAATNEAADARTRLTEREEELTTLRLREQQAVGQLGELKTDHDAHAAKVKGLQTDVLTLQAELERAKQQDDERKREFEHIRSELAGREARLQEAEHEQTELKQLSAQKQQELEELRAQLERLTVADEEQKGKSSELAQALEQARHESREAHQQMQLLTDQLATFKEELASKEQQQKTDGNRIGELTVELEQVREAQRSEQAQRQRVEKERDETLRQLAFAKESSTTEIAAEAQLVELRATHEAQLRSQQQLAEATISDLSTEINHLKTQLEQVRGEREYGHGELERRAVDAERRLQRLTQELEQTNTANVQLRQQSAQLAQKATKADTRASQAERRVNDLERKLAMVRNRPPANLGQAGQKSGNLNKGHLEALERERDLALNRLKRLERDRLEPLRARLEQVARERDEVVARLKEQATNGRPTVSAQELEHLKTQMKQLGTERDALTKQGQEQQKIIDSLEQELKELQASVAKGKSLDGQATHEESKHLQEQLAAKEREIQEQKAAIEALQQTQQETEVLAQKLQTQEESNKSSSIRLAELEQELIKVRADRTHLQEQNRQLTELTTSERTSELEAEIARLRNELDERKHELLSQTNESDALGQLRWEVEALKANLHERDQALAQAQAALSQTQDVVVQQPTAEHVLPEAQENQSSEQVGGLLSPGEPLGQLAEESPQDAIEGGSQEFEPVDGQFTLEPDKRSRFALVLLAVGVAAALALIFILIWVVVLGH